MAKTWAQKYNNGQKPKVISFHKPYAGIPAGEKFLISDPEEIDQYIRTIPKGKQVSFQTMKRDLAQEHGVEFMCPLTAGIFTRIVAELAYEKYRNGEKIGNITPFWRVMDLKMPLTGKLSFGVEFLKEQRKAEGLPD